MAALGKLLNARDLANIISQVIVKVISIGYGLLVIALAVRRLAPRDSYLLLAAANLVSLPGLLQLGLGYLIMQEVTNGWARSHGLRDLPIVRTGFLVIVCVSILASAIFAWLALEGRIPAAVTPLAIIGFAAQWTAAADYVRLAKGEILKTNLFISAATAVCAAIVVIALRRAHPSNTLIIFAALAPPFLASLTSFAVLCFNREFRALILRGRFVGLWRLIVSAAPMFVNTVAFSLMLVVPLSAAWAPWFPHLSISALACLRLTTSGIYIYYFLLQPLLPIFLRSWYGADAARLARTSKLLFGLLFAVCVAGGAAFALAGPAFIEVWLKNVQVAPATAAEWGLIWSLSAVLMTTVYFCQNTSRPIIAAATLLTMDLMALLAPFAGVDTVEMSMILGLVTGVALGAMALVSSVVRRFQHVEVAPAAPAIVETFRRPS